MRSHYTLHSRFAPIDFLFLRARERPLPYKRASLSFVPRLARAFALSLLAQQFLNNLPLFLSGKITGSFLFKVNRRKQLPARPKPGSWWPVVPNPGRCQVAWPTCRGRLGGGVSNSLLNQRLLGLQWLHLFPGPPCPSKKEVSTVHCSIECSRTLAQGMASVNQIRCFY